MSAGGIAQLVECLLARRKSWGPSPALNKLDIVLSTCSPRIGEVEERGSEIQGHSELHNKFKSSPESNRRRDAIEPPISKYLRSMCQFRNGLYREMTAGERVRNVANQSPSTHL